MAFSTHYRYANSYDNELRNNLESTYLRILDSLTTDGCFVYTPGADELELIVDTMQYRVYRFEIIDDLQTVHIRRTTR